MVTLNEVCQGIEENNLTSYNQWYDGYKNINAVMPDGKTLLTYAVRKGYLRSVSEVLKLGADVNEKERDGATPLFLAIYLNHPEIVRILVEKEANLQLRDSFNTPFTLAIKVGNLDTVKFLIDKGANTTDGDVEDVLPLFKAIRDDNVEVVKLLKNVGTGVVDEEKNTPLIAAIRYDASQEIIDCLVEDTDVDGSENEMTPLSWAAQKGDLDLVRKVLSAGGNINQLNQDGNTALATAVRFKQSEVAKFLIVKMANVCKAGDTGKTPLSWAVLNQDLQVVKWLLDHGAEYIIDSVLHSAIETQNLALVQLLKERGALVHPEEQTETEITPLAKALQLGSAEIAEYLIRNGASVVKSLKEQEVDTILNFLEKKKFDIVQLLTENGARIDVVGSCGDTLLTKAVKLEEYDLVVYFVSQGANVNQANTDGLTPLAIAESNNNFLIFQFLVYSGAMLKEGEENLKLVGYFKKAKDNSSRSQTLNSGIGCNQEADPTDSLSDRFKELTDMSMNLLGEL